METSCEKAVFRKLPPLMKGYQWLGAEIGGDPAYDPTFDTVDFFIILNKAKMAKKYKKHFG
jgi:putative hemolysin